MFASEVKKVGMDRTCLQLTKCDLKRHSMLKDEEMESGNYLPSRAGYPSSCFHCATEDDEFHAIDDGGAGGTAYERLDK